MPIVADKVKYGIENLKTRSCALLVLYATTSFSQRMAIGLDNGSPFDEETIPYLEVNEAVTLQTYLGYCLRIETISEGQMQNPISLY